MKAIITKWTIETARAVGVLHDAEQNLDWLYAAGDDAPDDNSDFYATHLCNLAWLLDALSPERFVYDD